MHSRLGFTLVELLITITIIAILSTIALVSYTSFIKNSRDAKRQSDLKLMQSALEQYHADQKYYPYSESVASGKPLTNSTGAPLGTTLSKTYLNTIPSDPSAVTPYLYKAYKADGTTGCDSTAAGQCTKYCLYAKMENSTQIIAACPDQSSYTLEVTSP